jgi:SAM-dependent methyltransferase
VPKHIFIDGDTRVFEGDEASALLANRNDRRFYEEGRGVARVDRERWLEAQRYERTTWMERNRGAVDDRNREHLARFFGYQALAGRHFERAIELGCGPFTNMRLILQVAAATHVHLLDPLIRDYAHHPQCRFRGGRLGGLRATALNLDSLLALVNPRVALSEVAASLRVGGVLGRPVQLEATGIEDFHTDHRFDLLVMINVIEHCRDLDAVLRKIDELLLPGGTFVFHDKFMSAAGVRATVEEVYDAGHPIRVQRGTLDAFLDPRFDVEYRAEFRDTDEFGGRQFDTTSVYFVGRRRGEAEPTAR